MFKIAKEYMYTYTYLLIHLKIIHIHKHMQEGQNNINSIHSNIWMKDSFAMCLLLRVKKCTPGTPEKVTLVCHQLELQHTAMPWLEKEWVQAQHDQLGPSRVYLLEVPLLHMDSGRREC